MTGLDGLGQLVAALEEDDLQSVSSSDSSADESSGCQTGDETFSEDEEISIDPIDANDTNDADKENVEGDNMEDLAGYGPSLQELGEHTRAQSKALGSKSTAKQYARLVEEYRQFSQRIFGDEEILVDRVFKFLLFQAHRSQRVQKGDDGEELAVVSDDEFARAFGDGEDRDGEDRDAEECVRRPKKKRRKRMRKTTKGKATKYVFNVEDYKNVMDHIRDDIAGKDVSDWVHADRLKSIEKHYSALGNAASNEVSLQIKTNLEIKKLVDNVKRRAKMMKVEADSEELCRVTEKFRYPELYDKCEKMLWNEHQTKGNWKYLSSTLRTRYTFLMTTQTCTRHEASLTCMLSSFEVVTHHLRDELEPYQILVRNIYKGKNNQEDSATILQAKSIRHKLPQMCEQGALAIYLFVRFYVMEEEFDFSQNKFWQKVRTTPSLNMSRKKFKEEGRHNKMKSSTYYAKLDKVFEHFGFNHYHVLHFGRSCQPVLQELEGVLIAVIEQLGMWNVQVCQKHYSLNLPFEALRVAAGFRKERGFYRLPRTHLKVPQELKRLVYPTIEKSKAKFRAMSKAQQHVRQMAEKFLRVMDHLAEVFVQDICQLRLEGRDMHLLYQHRFFRTKEFLSYEAEFRHVFATATDPRNDPTIDPIKKVAPLMGHHLGDVKNIMNGGFVSVGRQLQQMGMQVNSIHSILAASTLFHQHFNHVFNGAVNAHVNSPYLTPPNIVRPNTSNAVLPHNATSPQQPTQLAVQPPVTPEGEVAEHSGDDGDCPSLPPSLPEFDRLGYNSLEQIYNDWFGKEDSLFPPHGGIKSLYDKKEFRKSLGSDANKRAADKKMLQKMRRIGEYISSNCNDQSDVQCVFQHLRSLLSKSSKKDETLTGIDQIITKEKKGVLPPNE